MANDCRSINQIRLDRCRWVLLWNVLRRVSTHPRSSRDTNEVAKSRPKPLNTFTISQPKPLLKSGVIHKLAHPLMSISMHCSGTELETAAYFTCNDVTELSEEMV